MRNIRTLGAGNPVAGSASLAGDWLIADSNPIQRPHAIAVGYDGSESARRALSRAAALAGYGSQITVVTVATTPARLEESRRLLAEARSYLNEHRLFASTRERVGDAAEELVAAVRELDADLLVVGNGKTALQRLALGSVSTRVVHRAPCDVLVVR
jgi:nucleotide-binding universal stress UspA family protein